MEILLTAPPNVAEYAAKNPKKYPGIAGIYSDPVGQKLGSGGGTVNVLLEHFLKSVIRDSRIVNRKPARGNCQSKHSVIDSRLTAHDSRFGEWLASDKRIIIHSDGQSRRLPAYSTVGKSFIPFPVFKWGRGQRIDQTLFDVVNGK